MVLEEDCVGWMTSELWSLVSWWFAGPVFVAVAGAMGYCLFLCVQLRRQ